MSKVFILTDETVSTLWLANFKDRLALQDAVDIIVPAGETYKTLDTVQMIWSKLIEHHADRQSLLYNLGGGTVTDMGGFAASCFKRGIDFVNVPTTLLSMVDAAYGGKTGVDFCGLKNQIGVFSNPKDVVLLPDYLSTLPSRDIRSGLAEMIKYGFISDESLLNVRLNNYLDYIDKSFKIKQMIVESDPLEKNHSLETSDAGCTTHNARLILNFGHTIGHALESIGLETIHPLRHGEAVAMGMWCALWLSVQLCGLPRQVLDGYGPTMAMLIEESGFHPEDINVETISSLLVHDKKTIGECPRFVLLTAIGQPIINCEVPEELIRMSLCQLQDCLSRLC